MTSRAVNPINLKDAPEQSPRDICQHGADEEQCISGRIRMAWPLAEKKKLEVVVVVQSVPESSNHSHSFKILFEIGENYNEMLDLSPADEFRLSLKGAEVEKLAHPPKLSSLPMRLVFSKGVHIQWKHRGELWKTLNTWPLNNPGNNPGTDDWFLTQDEKEPNSELRGLKRNQDDKEETRHETEQRESHISSKQLKKRQRADAKRQKLNPSSRNTDSSHIKDKPTLTSNLPLPASSDKPEEHPAIAYSMDLQLDSQALPIPKEGNTEVSLSDHTTEFKAGLCSGQIISTALKDIRFKQMALLIGVVVTLSPPKATRTSEWMCFVNIVDPSNYSVNSSGLKINCFAKRYKEWLPHPEVGDVLILSNVKIVEYNGDLTGVCYHNRLSWAAFSPIKGEFHHGPLNTAPKEEGLAEGGFGVLFSPFFQPGPVETMYCIKLSDWWRNTTAQDPSEKVIIQTSGRLPRIHRLISEAGPSVPPSGYFDCTVEVVKGYNSNNNFSMVYTLYVTDYTRNEQAMTVQSNWCHPSLSEFVLQFEMWDAAAHIAESMQPGQYYSINNARMKINTAGYLEGKVTQNKIVQLSENDTGNMHLQALLERKKKFQAKKAASESNSNYLVIKDAQERMLFHCTVELLRVVSNTNGGAYLYVTDYTSHTRLKTLKEQPALQALDGCVVKIALLGEQRKIAEAVETGSFYCIRNLRLKDSPVEGCFCGTLGGSDKLVVKLNSNRTDNEHLNGLLRRRENWQRSRKQNQPKVDKVDHRQPDTDIEHYPLRKETRQPFLRIQDIFSAECPGRYWIRAKPIDFYPLDLQDAFYQRCSQCSIEIPKTAKACFKCGDFEHRYVLYYYQLYILVEDDDGQQLMISIGDKCPLLNGIERACIQENRAVLGRLRERLEPIMGNLAMVHNALKAGKHFEVNTSEFYFNVKSWLTSGGKKAFQLVEYEHQIS